MGVFLIPVFSVLAQIVEHGFSTAYGKRILPGIISFAWLHEDLLYLPVLHIHAVAPGALAEPEVIFLYQHAHLAGEVAGAVRQHLDVFYAQALGPLVHDVGVVDGEAIHVVYAESFKFIIMLFVSWQVDGGADGGISAGKGEEDDVSAGKEGVACDFFPAVLPFSAAYEG